MTYERFARYEQFVQDNYPQIVNEFLDKKDIEINERNEFDSYHKWLSRGRIVSRGQKSVKVKSSTPTSTPVFNYGAPVIDPNTGRQRFRSYKRAYSLFHIEQTEPFLVEEAV